MIEKKEVIFPVIAVGMLIFNSDGKILLGRRNEKFGNGMYGLPGGKVDKSETFAEAGVREAEEETGISPEHLKVGRYSSVSYERVLGMEGLTIGIVAYTSEQPKTISEEIGEWGWYSIDELPKNLFPPSERIIKNFKNGIVRGKTLSW